MSTCIVRTCVMRRKGFLEPFPLLKDVAGVSLCTYNCFQLRGKRTIALIRRKVCSLKANGISDVLEEHVAVSQ